MLSDEIGMHTLDVKKHVDVIESKLNKEDKLYNELVGISTKAKQAYKSKNANIMNSKNNSIEKNVEIKKTNLRSYKKYVEKMIHAYENTTARAIEIIKEDRRKMN